MKAQGDAKAELTAWWMRMAREEIDRTVPKAVEYGATDLVTIGRTLVQCMGQATTDEESAEIGIYFYLVGKMARWQDAIQSGRRVSDDTLFDIGVYVRMAQRIRTHGEWPGTDSKVDGAELKADPIVDKAYGLIGKCVHIITLTGAGDDQIYTNYRGVLYDASLTRGPDGHGVGQLFLNQGDKLYPLDRECSVVIASNDVYSINEAKENLE